MLAAAVEGDQHMGRAPPGGRWVGGAPDLLREPHQAAHRTPQLLCVRVEAGHAACSLDRALGSWIDYMRCGAWRQAVQA